MTSLEDGLQGGLEALLCWSVAAFWLVFALCLAATQAARRGETCTMTSWTTVVALTSLVAAALGFVAGLIGQVS
ncbi:MAG: hypothetical protein AAGH15_11910 [Myxococcota bacterium]